MDTNTLNETRRALASGVSRPLLKYFEARLAELQCSMLSCSEATFRGIQGRALECSDVIKLIKSVTE